MAKVQTVQFIDDLDGSPVEAELVETVRWQWQGVDYEFDTAARNLAEIEQGRVPVSKLLNASRRIRRTASSVSRRRGGRKRAAAVREWARRQGYDVPDRGRLSNEIVAAFDEANR
ncbi:LSR2-like protein [Gordonia polyisoprenivorans VH2]|uniref:LSR2-like protein n=1 Tax=Gordonia polyisoprenivorans (strain DSM 44266 / VH2) TaxID=1112204 RepID=H6N3H2_GORPV|nr:Lsr2 family protein [Gordonia polyisoprenivorans]AFA72331.1 LSR2-like protein [Gordonia polyisoprenivorans VH2]